MSEFYILPRSKNITDILDRLKLKYNMKPRSIVVKVPEDKNKELTKAIATGGEK